MPLEVAGVADAVDLVEVHHGLGVDGAEVVLDVRVERDDLAILDVGDGEVLSLEGIGGLRTTPAPSTSPSSSPPA